GRSRSTCSGGSTGRCRGDCVRAGCRRSRRSTPSTSPRCSDFPTSRSGGSTAAGPGGSSTATAATASSPARWRSPPGSTRCCAPGPTWRSGCAACSAGTTRESAGGP
ncbi:MAG: hypothetical protein AVDCRST_MAG40-2252, partial [uncultured Gemmatimonadaceae bacterium]